MGKSTSIAYTITDGARSIRENLSIMLFSAITVAFTLAICALFLIVFLNLNSVLEKWGQRNHIVVYVKDSAIKKGPDGLRAALKSIAGVEEVRFVSKEAALKELRGGLKGYEGVLEGVEPGLLPASFELRLVKEQRTPEGVAVAVSAVKRLKWVDDVQYAVEWVEKFSSLLKFMELAAFSLGAFLAGATVFIISNTIRLTIYARREEVEVMRLVGASDTFIKVPFFMEGTVSGFVGGVVALGVLLGVRFILSVYIPVHLGFVLDLPSSPLMLLLMLVSAGMLIGGGGSLISLGRFLKV